MRFAVFNHVPWPGGSTDAQVFDELVEQVQAAEALGFDSAWTTEHHFSRYGLASASLIVLTHLAARTSRIRLGTAIVIAPTRNPVLLAEEVATLDVLSGGRIDLGLGTGNVMEVDAFGVPRDESRERRTREVVEMVRGLFVEAVYSHLGKFFRADQLALSPRPVQVPHPPLFVAGVSRETIEWTAEQGLGFMTGVLPDTDHALGHRRMFFESATALGKAPDPDQVPFFRYVYVGESEAAVRAETEPAITWVRKCLEWIGARNQGHAGTFDEWLVDGPAPSSSFDEFVEARALFGTPAQIRRRVQELRDEHGVTYFGANFAFGTLPHASVMKSMRLFAREVVEKLR